MDYEWDDAKAAANLARHGVALMDAIAALEDERRLEWLDDRFDYGEERTVTVGMAIRGILFVVTTLRGQELCRIISARKATKHEQDLYFQG